MVEPRSISWLLSTEELLAACTAIGIDALPHSTRVGPDLIHPSYVEPVGRRSLQIARLATPGPDGRLEVEPLLRETLLALNTEHPQAIASLKAPGDVVHAAVFVGDDAVAMVETDDGIEVIREPGVDALVRLEARLFLLVLQLQEAAGEETRPHETAEIPLSRWQALLTGRSPRRTDAPLAVAAASAAADAGIWEGGALLVDADGGFAGAAGAWTYDDRGLLSVELAADQPGDESLLTVAVVEDAGAELFSLWQPVRDHVAAHRGAPAPG